MIDFNPEASALFNDALNRANSYYEAHGDPYHVALNQKNIDPTQPIFIKVVINNREEMPIGVVHLIQLEGSNFDQQVEKSGGWKEIALSVDQLRSAILKRVNLYLEARKNSNNDYTLLENGQIFKFGECEVKVEEDGYFSVNGKEIKFKNERIKISRILSEGVSEFKKLSSGHVQIVDNHDKRIGKGIYIDENGNIYRN